mmetsp:Transcript_44099/g.110693  ORF Transcript_44099/g.110693 Transcript_44099/m.110693 type:complete len:490 (+) Transcript_44099:265-1734(+)|eukprot:jgi/Tetstr1/432916/TSEL_022256.t1
MGGGVLLVAERLEWLLGTKWKLEALGLNVTATESVAEALASLGAAPTEFGLILVARPLVLGSAAALAAAAGGAPVVGFAGAPAVGQPDIESDAADQYAALLPGPGLAASAAGLSTKYGLAASVPPAGGWDGPFNALALKGKRVLLVSGADADTCRYLGVVLQAAGLSYTSTGALPPDFASRGFDCLITSCSGLGVAAAKEAAAAGLKVVAFGEDEAGATDFADPMRDAAPGAPVLSFPLRRHALLEAIYKATNATNPPPPPDLAFKLMPDPPLDLNELLEQFEGDWEFMRDLLTCFLDEGVKRMEKLLDAVRTANNPDIKFVAHTMKGSSRSCCLMRIGDLFADVDSLSKQHMSPEKPPPNLLQSITLLVSLCQQFFLHAMDFDYGLQHLKIVDVVSGLEAADGSWDVLSGELVEALSSGLAAVASKNPQAASGVVEMGLVEYAAPEVYNKAMDVLESGAGSFPDLEECLHKLQADMCRLMGRKAVPPQ